MNEEFKAWHLEHYGFFTQMESQIGDIVRERFAVFLAGQAVERKRCAEIARNSKCGANDQDCSEDRAHDRVCEDIAKAIEGSE